MALIIVFFGYIYIYLFIFFCINYIFHEHWYFFFKIICKLNSFSVFRCRQLNTLKFFSEKCFIIRYQCLSIIYLVIFQDFSNIIILLYCGLKYLNISITRKIFLMEIQEQDFHINVLQKISRVILYNNFWFYLFHEDVLINQPKLRISKKNWFQNGF